MRNSRRALVAGLSSFLVVVAGGLQTAVANQSGPEPGPAPGVSTAAALPLPLQLRDIGDARQLIVVHAPNWSTSRASVQLWEKYSSGWHQKGNVSGRLGWSGFEWAEQRRQSDGSTPAGTFSISRAFGIAPDPGTDLPYRRAWMNDWWAYDPRCPSTYNTWQKYSDSRCWRTSWAEQLKTYGKQYEAAAVIDFNIPTSTRTADTRRGGGIFLHVNGSGATEGCVSLRRSDLLRVVRWLDPQLNPRIVMGPSSVIRQV